MAGTYEAFLSPYLRDNVPLDDFPKFKRSLELYSAAVSHLATRKEFKDQCRRHRDRHCYHDNAKLDDITVLRSQVRRPWSSLHQCLDEQCPVHPGPVTDVEKTQPTSKNKAEDVSAELMGYKNKTDPNFLCSHLQRVSNIDRLPGYKRSLQIYNEYINGNRSNTVQYLQNTMASDWLWNRDRLIEMTELGELNSKTKNSSYKNENNYLVPTGNDIKPSTLISEESTGQSSALSGVSSNILEILEKKWKELNSKQADVQEILRKYNVLFNSPRALSKNNNATTEVESPLPASAQSDSNPRIYAANNEHILNEKLYFKPGNPSLQQYRGRSYECNYQQSKDPWLQQPHLASASTDQGQSKDMDDVKTPLYDEINDDHSNNGSNFEGQVLTEHTIPVHANDNHLQGQYHQLFDVHPASESDGQYRKCNYHNYTLEYSETSSQSTFSSAYYAIDSHSHVNHEERHGHIPYHGTDICDVKNEINATCVEHIEDNIDDKFSHINEGRFHTADNTHMQCFEEDYVDDKKYSVYTGSTSPPLGVNVFQSQMTIMYPATQIGMVVFPCSPVSSHIRIKPYEARQETYEIMYDQQAYQEDDWRENIYERDSYPCESHQFCEDENSTYESSNQRTRASRIMSPSSRRNSSRTRLSSSRQDSKSEREPTTYKCRRSPRTVSPTKYKCSRRSRHKHHATTQRTRSRASSEDIRRALPLKRERVRDTSQKIQTSRQSRSLQRARDYQKPRAKIRQTSLSSVNFQSRTRVVSKRSHSSTLRSDRPTSPSAAAKTGHVSGASQTQHSSTKMTASRKGIKVHYDTTKESLRSGIKTTNLQKNNH